MRDEIIDLEPVAGADGSVTYKQVGPAARPDFGQIRHGLEGQLNRQTAQPNGIVFEGSVFITIGGNRGNVNAVNYGQGDRQINDFYDRLRAQIASKKECKSYWDKVEEYWDKDPFEE